jgi:hypothetical protein
MPIAELAIAGRECATPCVVELIDVIRLDQSQGSGEPFGRGLTRFRLESGTQAHTATNQQNDDGGKRGEVGG